MSTPHNDPLVEASVKQITEDRKEGQRFLDTLEDKIEDFDVLDLSEIAILALAIIENKLKDDPKGKSLLSQARNATTVASKLSDSLLVRK